MARASVTKQQQNAAPTVGDDLTNKTYVDAAVATTPTGIVNPTATTMQQALAAIDQYVQNLEEKTEQHHHDGRYVGTVGDQSVLGDKQFASVRLAVDVHTTNPKTMTWPSGSNLHLMDVGSLTLNLPSVSSEGMVKFVKNIDTSSKRIVPQLGNINGSLTEYGLAPGETVGLMYSSTRGWETIGPSAYAVQVTANGIIVPSATNVQNAIAQVESYVQNFEERFEQHHHDDRYNGPRWHLYPTGNVTVIHTGYGSIGFDAELVDTAGGHDTVTNNSRYTVQKSGWYIVNAGTLLGSGAYGAASITFANRFLVDGATAYGVQTSVVAGTAQPSLAAASHLYLRAGQYIEYQAERTDGFDGTGLGGDPSLTFFSGTWIAP